MQMHAGGSLCRPWLVLLLCLLAPASATPLAASRLHDATPSGRPSSAHIRGASPELGQAPVLSRGFLVPLAHSADDKHLPDTTPTRAPETLTPHQSNNKDRCSCHPAPDPPDPRPTSADRMDLFAKPIGAGGEAGDLPACIPSRPDHPQAPLGTTSDSRKAAGPIETNKFYANLMLGDQDFPAYLMPYSVSWTRGRPPTTAWGLTVSYVVPEMRVFGPNDSPCNHHSKPSAYFFSPPVLQNFILDAAGLDNRTVLTVEEPTDLSVMVSLRPGSADTAPAIRFPLVQGQGLITALYDGARPIIHSAQAFLSLEHTPDCAGTKPGVQRYVAKMNDNSTWLLYARAKAGSAPIDLRQSSPTRLEAQDGFSGSLQMARVLHPEHGFAALDAAAGVYASGTTLSGTTIEDGRVGSYRFTFTKKDVAGDAQFSASSPLLMFALPHHVASFDDRTTKALQDVEMQTTTKGAARAVLADEWTMIEPDLPVSLSFLPWEPKTNRSVHALMAGAHETIKQVAQQELAQDMDAQTNLDSMYYSGKGLAKFALVLLSVSKILGDDDGARAGLDRLKAAFARFAENRQQHPLVYEGTWGGVVSTASYTLNDPNVDFGNSYYNDHHFHYGYFVYAAAIIAHLDPAWATDANRAYVDTLVRDYANPSHKDPRFPVFRSFDWYHGHSWAHGLFASMDGKDQESSSEDAMSVYALKLWGQATGDALLEARSNLMLAVQARSIRTYYYYEEGNTAEPSSFIGNQVGGIVFENKIDHTTYFGREPEYIHGIHMIPLLPCSPFFRRPDYVRQEWDDTFAGGKADTVPGGWRGILYGNLATLDPHAAYAFFSQPDFNASWLDGGASRTWYLAYAAVLASGA